MTPAGPASSGSASPASSIGWTDSHCHLQDEFFPGGEAEQLLGRAFESGVARAVCIGTGLASSEQAVALAGSWSRSGRGPSLWASVGLHPHDASEGTAPVQALARKLALPPTPRVPGSVVAIGECGLDYHYDHSPRPVQRQAFAEQVALARELELALVVHTREAFDDTLAILADGDPGPTVIHCFTGGPAEAERCLEAGAYLSFSGIVTFKNAGEVREAARRCPLDRLLVETDSPFLAPAPHRGRPNEPALVALVGAALAGLLGLAVEEVAEATSANARSLYSLASAP